MKKTAAARDAMCSRPTDEITFQAGLLALHAAIVSAGTELKNPPEEFGTAPARLPSQHRFLTGWPLPVVK